jgi:hypothetical protein
MYQLLRGTSEVVPLVKRVVLLTKKVVLLTTPVGLVYALAAMALLLHYVDLLFLSQALTMGLPDSEIPANVGPKLTYFHNVICSTSMLLWVAVCCIKFSQLFFFRKLIHRMQGHIMAWWWFVLVFNVVITVYRCKVYFLPCPWSDLLITCTFYKVLPPRLILAAPLQLFIVSPSSRLTQFLLLVKCVKGSYFRRVLGFSYNSNGYC